jgi:hypothetical protein
MNLASPNTMNAIVRGVDPQGLKNHPNQPSINKWALVNRNPGFVGVAVLQMNPCYVALFIDGQCLLRHDIERAPQGHFISVGTSHTGQGLAT